MIDQPAGTAFLQTKGHARILAALARATQSSVLRAFSGRRDWSTSIQAGGDLYVAGRRGDRPWRLFGIADPRNPDGEIFARVELSDSTFSTSGDYERFFIKDGVPITTSSIRQPDSQRHIATQRHGGDASGDSRRDQQGNLPARA